MKVTLHSVHRSPSVHTLLGVAALAFHRVQPRAHTLTSDIPSGPWRRGHAVFFSALFSLETLKQEAEAEYVSSLCGWKTVTHFPNFPLPFGICSFGGGQQHL